ncbi:MAG TPA: hypothetical protein VIN40_00510 [Candidatus Tyrphobacter sp.]
MRFARMPRSREEIESAIVESTSDRAQRALLLETLLDVRDLMAECAWRLSDLTDQRRRPRRRG